MRLKMLQAIPQIDGGVRWLFGNREVGLIAIDEDEHGKRERMVIHSTRARGEALEQAFVEAEMMLMTQPDYLRAAYLGEDE